MTPEQEKEWLLVKAYMDFKSERGEGDAEIEGLVAQAYKSGYFILSDGCTIVSERRWPKRAPECVLHDYLFFIGWSFGTANIIMARALRYFGGSIARKFTRFFGVWLGGYPAYRAHRRKGRNIDSYGTKKYIDQELEKNKSLNHSVCPKY